MVLLVLSKHLLHLGLCYLFDYLLVILQRLQELGLNVYIRCAANDRNCLLMILHGVTVTEGPSSTL